MRERQFHFGESHPGPFAGFITAYVEEGRAIAATEANLERREGALDGLRACEEMRQGEVIDFELAVLVMKGIDDTNRGRFQARDLSQGEYKRHQIATGKLNLCYHLLRVAHEAHYGEIYNSTGFMFTDGKHNPRRNGKHIENLYYELADRIPANRPETIS